MLPIAYLCWLKLTSAPKVLLHSSQANGLLPLCDLRECTSRPWEVGNILSHFMHENISLKPEFRSRTCWWLLDWPFSIDILWLWEVWLLPIFPFTKKCCRIRNRSSLTDGGLWEPNELWNIPLILVAAKRKKQTIVIWAALKGLMNLVRSYR